MLQLSVDPKSSCATTIMYKLILVSAVIIAAKAAHLPNWAVPCARNNPNLNKCALDAANKVVPQLIEGYKPFHVPSLNPFELDKVDIHASSNLDLNLKKLKLFGLAKTEVKDIRIDLKAKTVAVDVYLDTLNIQSHYDMTGQILILPISGSGPMNLTAFNAKFSYSFDFELVEKKGEEYMSLVSPKITWEIPKANFHFENLFNGDATLGPQMNKFLNENSVDVLAEVAPAISETVSTVVSSVIKSFFDRVPYSELFT